MDIFNTFIELLRQTGNVTKGQGDIDESRWGSSNCSLKNWCHVRSYYNMEIWSPILGTDMNVYVAFVVMLSRKGLHLDCMFWLLSPCIILFCFAVLDGCWSKRYQKLSSLSTGSYVKNQSRQRLVFQLSSNSWFWNCKSDYIPYIFSGWGIFSTEGACGCITRLSCWSFWITCSWDWEGFEC